MLAASSFVDPQSPSSPFGGKLCGKLPGQGHRRTSKSWYCSSAPRTLSGAGSVSVEARPLCHLLVSCHCTSEAPPLDWFCQRSRAEVSCQPRGRSCHQFCSSQALPLLCHRGSGSEYLRQLRVLAELGERLAMARKKKSVGVKKKVN